MNVSILQRSVARIDRPTVQMGRTPEHRVRTLIASGDPKAADPFLLLMEGFQKLTWPAALRPCAFCFMRGVLFASPWRRGVPSS